MQKLPLLVGTPIGTQTSSTITLAPGYYTGSVTFTDSTIIFDGQNNPDAFWLIKGPASTFTRSNFTLINGALASKIFVLTIDAITNVNSNISGTFITNTFSFTSSSASPKIMTGHILSTGAVTMTNSAGSVNIFSSSTIPDFSDLTAIPSTHTMTSLPVTMPTVCYAKGTLILTKHGYVPIEKIRAGHKVVTQGKIKNHTLQSKIKVEPVVWISKFKSTINPICIQKNALGKNHPFQDLYVSPDHSMLINNKMIRAKYLVNSVSIYQIDYEEVVYYHLECEHHSAIVANGVLSETYVDLDNRHLFEDSVRIQPPTFMSLIMS